MIDVVIEGVVYVQLDYWYDDYGGQYYIGCCGGVVFEQVMGM